MTTAETQTLHPYFDNIDDVQWLAARVIETTPAAIHFFVDPPAAWSQLTIARAHYHFSAFDLGTLYSVQASDEISAIAYYLTIQYDAGGEAAVRTYLEEMADSRSAVRLNSWMAAAYRAMATSSWYCSGGFKLIEPRV